VGSHDRHGRAVFAQVRRLVHPGGLFVFHVNSLQDRPLRADAVIAVRRRLGCRCQDQAAGGAAARARTAADHGR
jgi:hypothetical protein